MPVLWQPTRQTILNTTCTVVDAVYTLNVVTTQWIARGILFRFQMYDGNETYATASIAEFDLVIKKAIPPATTLIVKVSSTGTGIYAYAGPQIYASGGRGVSAGYFVAGSSLLCFAFAPTATGCWTPAAGRPMFAIGFNNPIADQKPTCCEGVTTGSATAPNFPDQWTVPVLAKHWIFHYEVVFPIETFNPLQTCLNDVDADCCLSVAGIKVRGDAALYATGSWSNLRDKIAQPWTVVKDSYYTSSRWVPYISTDTSTLRIDEKTAETGPFLLAAMPGQLATVYFRPRYKDSRQRPGGRVPGLWISRGGIPRHVAVRAQPNRVLLHRRLQQRHWRLWTSLRRDGAGVVCAVRAVLHLDDRLQVHSRRHRRAVHGHWQRRHDHPRAKRAQHR